MAMRPPQGNNGKQQLGGQQGKKFGQPGKYNPQQNQVKPLTPQQLAAQQQASDALIREVFLRTVSRPPKPNELADARAAMHLAATPIDGVRTLLWTMLNTKEFIVNH
jgi:hypothetical protein